MIYGQNVFNQPVKNSLRTCDNTGKIWTGEGDNYTIGCQLDCSCFNEYYKMIAIYLSKQQALDADPKAIQQINFTINLNRIEDANDNRTMFFIIEEPKETISDCPWVTVKVL